MVGGMHILQNTSAHVERGPGPPQRLQAAADRAWNVDKSLTG